MTTEEERDPDDPCVGCLLDTNCTGMCPKAITYNTAQLETRPGKWVWSNEFVCLVWEEYTQIPPLRLVVDNTNEDQIQEKEMNLTRLRYLVLIPILVPIVIMALLYYN